MDYRYQYKGSSRPSSTIDIYIDKLDGPNGVCKRRMITKRFSGYRYIEKIIIIDKDFWDGSDFYKRQEIVFHELGHCDLDLGHIDDRLHIMNSSVMQIDTSSRWEEFIFDFFTKNAKVISEHADKLLYKEGEIRCK
jgi:hypothetical protein